MTNDEPIRGSQTALRRGGGHSDDEIAALRETVSCLRTIADRVPSMLAYWGSDQRCQYANAAYEQWFGVKPEALVGKTLEELLGPVLYSLNLPYILGALAGDRQHFEREIPNPRGGPARYSQADYIPEIVDGVVRGFVVLVSDISQRRKLELSLKQAQEEASAAAARARSVASRLERVISAMADGLVVQDAEGRVTSSNEAAHKILGVSEEELIERPLSDPGWRALKDDGSPFPVDARPWVEAERTGRRVENVAMGIHKPDGSLKWVDVNCFPSVDPDGTVRETVMTLHDVTLLRNTIARASQQDRLAMAGALAAGVGHEINNPLTYIIGNLDLALEELRAIGGPSPPSRLVDLAVVLREAREGSERIRKIVRGLRALSREDVALQPVDVGNAIEMALNIGAHELRKKASVIVHHGENLPCALADESRLTQVLVNLMVNAAQAFETSDPERNQINVSTRLRAPDSLVLTISDNGPGVPATLRRRIFDPFFTTKPVGEGTGLGLSVSRSIMDSMGGELALGDAEGRGATFELVLRVATETELGLFAASEPESAERGASPPRDAASRGRIAVVDDEPAVANVIRRILSKEHDVVAFNDAKTALDAFEQGQLFDVVFCDVMMPHIGGDDLFRRVCASRPELADKFVFITGAQTNPSVQAFLSRIPNERMEKPFPAQNLLGLARRFVGLSRAARD